MTFDLGFVEGELASDVDRNGVVDFADFCLFGVDWLLETSWYVP